MSKFRKNKKIIDSHTNGNALKKVYRIYPNTDKTDGIAITSKDNRQFKTLKKLTGIEGINRFRKTIVSGKKTVTDIICAPVKKTGFPTFSPSQLIIFDGYEEAESIFNDTISNFSESGFLLILKKSLFNQLDIFKTGKPLLVVNIPEIQQWDYSLSPGCNLLIPFQDPENVGAIIRSAVGFNITNIILLKESANPFHPKSIRSSAGAALVANIKKGPSIYSLRDILRNKKLSLISLDKNGHDIESFTFPANFLLLPGIEGPGLPDSLKDISISIPLDENIESLNAAVAASIAIYEWKKRE